eukprot:TRINITY_DN112457_c0_g1_i1.p1 TRINITY_DN112457_c0_g1~~TRINITY_DN112457_c0_g1_i1.p1  ORF type:complete len:272 (-),score=77.98 TRINITY_DN112457_c0_g1_i1:51-866(-)
MSLAQLLGMGRKEAEPATPSAASSSAAPSGGIGGDSGVTPSSSSTAPAPKVVNQEDLKFAQELLQSQSKELQAEAKKRQEEEEAAAKAEVDRAARIAKAMADKAKAAAAASPFSTGGRGDFKPGEWVCDRAHGTSIPSGARTKLLEDVQRERSRSPLRQGMAGGPVVGGADAWAWPADGCGAAMAMWGAPAAFPAAAWGKGGVAAPNAWAAGWAGGDGAWGKGGCVPGLAAAAWAQGADAWAGVSYGAGYPGPGSGYAAQGASGYGAGPGW